MMRQFELRVSQHQTGGLALELSEKDSKKTIRIWDLPLKVLTETLLNTLKKHGYRSTELSLKRKAPFTLPEAPGVRLAILFFTLKPMSKPGRMEEVVAGVNAMSDEEAYYWYAKCLNGPQSRRIRKALRILLAEE